MPRCYGDFDKYDDFCLFCPFSLNCEWETYIINNKIIL